VLADASRREASAEWPNRRNRRLMAISIGKECRILADIIVLTHGVNRANEVPHMTQREFGRAIQIVCSFVLAGMCTVGSIVWLLSIKAPFDLRYLGAVAGVFIGFWHLKHLPEDY
jgi:hypothetical protein